MSKMQRDKGASFEREIANELRPLYPDARRGLGQARSAGEVCDVEETPFWLELKRHRNVSIQAAMKQAIETTDGRPPVVISKDNRGDTLVTMRLQDWMRLAEALRDLESACVRVGAAAEADAVGMLGECFGDEEAA